MIFRPLVSGWILVLFALLGVALCVLGARRRARGSRWVIVRRLLMVALAALLLAGPSVVGGTRQVSANTEVWVVIDRTGSMAAEDWDGDHPRLDGVRRDVKTLLTSMAGARFSVLTFDSSTRTVIPLTTDVNAVQSFLDTFHQEVTEFSQGSSPDVPAATLVQKLGAAKAKNPQNQRYLFVLTDGETSNQDLGATTAADVWSQAKGLVDGGLVIGYGTEKGAHMRSYELTGSDRTQSGGGGAGSQSGGGGSGSQSGGGDYIRDHSRPGAPEAVSHIDETKLREIASELGVDYVHSPDTATISSRASAMMADATLTTEREKELSVYRYLEWPFALGLAALLAWEAATLAGRARAMRRTHVI